jgi:hypothetical protein
MPLMRLAKLIPKSSTLSLLVISNSGEGGLNLPNNLVVQLLNGVL